MGAKPWNLLRCESQEKDSHMLTNCGYLLFVVACLKLNTHGFVMMARPCDNCIWMPRSATKRSASNPWGDQTEFVCVELESTWEGDNITLVLLELSLPHVYIQHKCNTWIAQTPEIYERREGLDTWVEIFLIWATRMCLKIPVANNMIWSWTMESSCNPAISSLGAHHKRKSSIEKIFKWAFPG